VLIHLAQAARDALNFTVHEGRELLILPFDKNLKASIKSNLFVKNLGPKCTNRDLYNLFRPFGDISSSKLALDLEGKSKRYGYVQYKNIEDAKKAKTEMNGKEYEGKKLVVDYYKAPERKDPSKGFTNVYVKSLPPEVTTKEELEKLFKPFGPITSSFISSKEYQEKLSYYGFINFEKPEDAVKAIEGLNDKEINGAKLFVTKALSRDQYLREKMRRKNERRANSRKTTLYVKSKGEPLARLMVEEEFKGFGEIKSVTIQTDKQGDMEIPTVVGFVEYAKQEDAERVHILFKI
jgi:polyadenylate-binding protein